MATWLTQCQPVPTPAEPTECAVHFPPVSVKLDWVKWANGSLHSIIAMISMDYICMYMQSKN